jgi:hypothetical protein
MTYRAKEVKKITEFSNRMKDLKLAIGKTTGSVRFFWLDDHLEVEEKFWHPLIMLKYLLLLLFNASFAIIGVTNSFIGFDLDSFRSSDHPTARRITDKKEIENAIANDKSFRKNEFEKYSWV